MPPRTLYRLAAFAGLLSALILVVNSFRRAGVLPSTQLTHGIAPASATLGLFAITGLYLWQRQQAGTLGLVGYGLNLAGLAAAVGTEFIINYVFPQLDADTVKGLVAGTTGRSLLLAGLLLLIGVVVFSIASWRAGVFPRFALAAYVIGVGAAGLRTVLPLAASTLGLLVAAGATTWLSIALWRQVSRGEAPARL
jgi:hypothetical protein